MDNRVIGLNSYAMGGKDLFFSLLSKKIECRRFSLGDLLKLDCQKTILERYGFDILNCSLEQKNAARQFLVDTARVNRGRTGGRFYLDRLNGEIISYLKNSSGYAVITDIRYAKYPSDEVFWLKNELRGLLVSIRRYNYVNNKKIYLAAPNADEEENFPKILKLSDYIVDWPTVDDNTSFSSLSIYIEEFIKYLRR